MSGFANDLLPNCQLAPRSSRIGEQHSVGLATGFAATLRLWRRRIGERRALAGLDDRELRDFGRSRSDIQGELAKPFWRE